MLSKRIIEEIKEQAFEYFGSRHAGLGKAVELLADDGYTWDSMRPILFQAYNAGRDHSEWDELWT